MRRRTPPEILFWRKVLGGDLDQCWMWQGPRDHGGYGRFYIGRRNAAAHRWAYEHLIATIPPGLTIDHLCRTRACVNPWHLEPVPLLINVRRRLGGKPRMEDRTRCGRGHPLTPELIYVRPRDGAQMCKKCQREDVRNWRLRQKAMAASSI